MKLWQVLRYGEHWLVCTTEPTSYSYHPCSYRELPATEHVLRETFLRDHCTIQMPDWFPHNSEHYCRPDPKNPLLIRYWNGTKSLAQRPGRYLRAFFPELTNINDLSARWGSEFAPIEVKFAKTADEIEEVYLNGPSSCMSHGPGHFSSPHHPVRVYEGPDLAIAYFGDIEDVRARTLVWPEKKVYGRLYGDEIRLRAALKLLGYHEDNGREFRGARMTLVDSDSGYVCPYIDNYSYVDEQHPYLVIGQGDLNAQSQSGETGPCGEYCEYYDERRDEESFSVIVDRHRSTVSWCESAVDNHAFYCDHIDSYVDSSLGEEVRVGNVTHTWSVFRVEAEAILCDATEEYYPAEDTVVLPNGETWSRKYWEEHDDAPALENQDIAA